VLAIDLSTSMQAEDLQPGNRLTVAKQVAEDFIQHRPHDRIGVVAFRCQRVHAVASHLEP
jgi:Ca-activated chloride channel family protein